MNMHGMARFGQRNACSRLGRHAIHTAHVYALARWLYPAVPSHESSTAALWRGLAAFVDATTIGRLLGDRPFPGGANLAALQ